MGAYRNYYSVLLIVLFAAACSSARTVPQNEDAVSVVGATSCLDCTQKNIKTQNAFQGLNVAIKCKTAKGDYAIKSIKELDSKGEFSVQLPGDFLKDDCIAQLHGVKNKPCPNPSKIVFTSDESGKPVFGSAGQLSFSPATCASAFFWKHPLYKYFHDKPWKTFFHQPLYKPPVYSPPVESPPVYKPPVQTPPVYKPPVENPPAYKPPIQSPPAYKPPVVEKPPAYKPPLYKKPCPPIFFHKPLPPIPPTYVKPVPTIPKYLPIVYKKPFPTLPPVYDHPFFKKPYYKFPPLHDHPFFKTPFYKHWHPTPPVDSP